MSTTRKIEALGLALPPAPSAAGIYKPALVIENICYVAGHLPVKPDGSLIKGRVGADLDQAAGYDAARQVGLTILSTLKGHFGDLDCIERVIKLFGMVSCTPEFDQQPAVINGCSELFRDLWGDSFGVGTRSAVGVDALPLGVPVEIEGMFALKS